MFVDTSTLVQVDALRSSTAYPLGTFAQPVDLSAAIPESVGAPLGWWVRGPVAGTLSSALQKAGGQSITVAQFDTPGTNVGTALTTFSDAGSFSWSDGPSGHVTGTADKNVQAYTNFIATAGFDISVPCPMWPDWQILRVFNYEQDRRVQYIGSINDTLGSTQTVTINKGDSGSGDPRVNWEWVDTRPIETRVMFSSIEAGRTFKYRISALYEYPTGIQAVQLFKAKSVKTRPRGAFRALMATGYAGRLGAR